MRLSIQFYREIVIGISRKFLRNEQAFRSDDANEGDEDETDDIVDVQAGHESHVAGMIYARDIMKGSEQIVSQRQKFRASSEEWHRFLGFIVEFTVYAFNLKRKAT